MSDLSNVCHIDNSFNPQLFELRPTRIYSSVLKFPIFYWHSFPFPIVYLISMTSMGEHSKSWVENFSFGIILPLGLCHSDGIRKFTRCWAQFFSIPLLSTCWWRKLGLLVPKFLLSSFSPFPGIWNRLGPFSKLELTFFCANAYWWWGFNPSPLPLCFCNATP